MADLLAVRRLSDSCLKVGRLAREHLLDVRIDGSCPSLEFLKEEDRPDYDEGLYRRISESLEALGFRMRVLPAYRMPKLSEFRDLFPDATSSRSAKGALCPLEREVLIQAHRSRAVRLLCALHECCHLSDILATFMLGTWEYWVVLGADLRLIRLAQELCAFWAAAALADAWGLNLYRYVTGVQVAVWRLRDAAGREQDPAAFAERCLERIAPRAASAASLAWALLAGGMDCPKEGRRDAG